MNPYLVALLALFVAFLAQLAATRLLVERYFRQPKESGRDKWLLLAGGMLLPAIAHFFSLHLALVTGMYDFRQALLAVLSGLLCGFGCYRLCRQPS